MADALVIRPSAGDDRPAILALLAATISADAGGDAAGLSAVLWDAAGPGAVCLVAEHAGEVVGVVHGVTEARDDVVAGFVTVVAVAAEHRRGGIGRRLVSVLERKLAAAGAQWVQTGGSAPRYWWPGIDSTDASTAGFFAACGYAPTDLPLVANLDVDLVAHRGLVTTPPPVDLPVRRLTRDELPAFTAWMEATWGSGWAAEVQTALDRDPIGCFVAYEDGAYLGFAAYDTNRAGWFGPMGSDPQARGRGVGSALVRACLSDYLDAGRRSCEIAWVGPVDFYARTVGAVPGRTFVRLRRALA